MKATVYAKVLVQGPQKHNSPAPLCRTSPSPMVPRTGLGGLDSELSWTGCHLVGTPPHMGAAHPAVSMPSEKSPEGIAEEARWVEGDSCVPITLAQHSGDGLWVP